MSTKVEPSWYVVEGREGKAQDARLRLATAGMNVWMPMLLKRQPDRRLRKSEPGRRRLDVYVPRFGRYFFVRCILTDSLRHAINDTPSIAGMLCGPGNEAPIAVPDAYIEWLKQSPDKILRRPDERIFERGDVVKVTSGPFAGFESKVESIDKSCTLHLLIEVFGRRTPIVLDAGQVELVLQAKPRATSGPLSSKVRSVA